MLDFNNDVLFSALMLNETEKAKYNQELEKIGDILNRENIAIQNYMTNRKVEIAKSDKNMQEAYKQSLSQTPQETKANLNDFTFTTDTQNDINAKNQQENPLSEPLSESGQETLNIANNLQEPQRFRNTGIPYFDRLEKPTIGDLYLAKMLGLNMQYTYLDANINANVKKADVGKARSELANLMGDAQTLLSGVQHYEDTYNKQKNDRLPASNSFANFGRKLTDFTGGLINFSNNDNEKILADNKRDVYTLASLLAGGGGKRTNQNIKDAKDMIDNTWKGRDYYFASVASGIESGMNYMNEKINHMEAMGIPISHSNRIKMGILNDMRRDLRDAQGENPLNKDYAKRAEALAVLNEKGDNGINEAMKIIFSK